MEKNEIYQELLNPRTQIANVNLKISHSICRLSENAEQEESLLETKEKKLLIEYIEGRQKIKAIKALRSIKSGLSLRAAKDAVDMWCNMSIEDVKAQISIL